MPAAHKLRGIDGFFYFSTGSPITSTGTTSSSSTSVTGVGTGLGIVPGMVVSGTGITAGTTVVSYSGSTVTLSADPTSSGSESLTFTPAVTKMAHCAGWDLTVKADEIDASDHDSQGWKEKLDGLKEFSGTIDAMYFTNDTTQESLITSVLTGGVVVNAEFRPLDSTGEKNYTGPIVITDFKTSAKGSTAQAVNLSFSGRGPLTRGTIS